ncbi:unnamed protein product [Somion occarium]|uniref:Uncharacterized protein n=1 Tax=Somion occarium TaxID=3059160 RepID=A0ABP1DDA8_9APHY
MASSELPVINVHTPTSSFSIIFSNTEDTLHILFDKISKKAHTEFRDRRVKPGWVKYSWNGSTWNLDDDSDFIIFIWRQKSVSGSEAAPTLHVRNPEEPLPASTDYRNPSFHLFISPPSSSSPSPRPHSRADGSSQHSKKTRKSKKPTDDIPAFKKEFERYHNEHGVRTVMGSIGPVNNVRMLLKNGYRHVYISRKFALKHGFIPLDASPGHYGYEGLVNIGNWPVTVGRTRTTHTVYLSEESHFDVVLGRSFWEKRQVKFDPVDPTDIVCMDTGEKIDCELVILKDGKGQIVTVT